MYARTTSPSDNLSERREDIPSLGFNVPPLPLQRRIAVILSTYDELIENSPTAHQDSGDDGPRPLPRVVRPFPLFRPRKPPPRRVATRGDSAGVGGCRLYRN